MTGHFGVSVIYRWSVFIVCAPRFRFGFIPSFSLQSHCRLLSTCYSYFYRLSQPKASPILSFPSAQQPFLRHLVLGMNAAKLSEQLSAGQVSSHPHSDVSHPVPESVLWIALSSLTLDLSPLTFTTSTSTATSARCLGGGGLWQCISD